MKEESDENKSGASSQDYGEHILNLSSSSIAPHQTHKTLITQFKDHDICSARADSSSVSSAFVGQDHCCEDLEAMYDATHSIRGTLKPDTATHVSNPTHSRRSNTPFNISCHPTHCFPRRTSYRTSDTPDSKQTRHAVRHWACIQDHSGCY